MKTLTKRARRYILRHLSVPSLTLARLFGLRVMQVAGVKAAHTVRLRPHAPTSSNANGLIRELTQSAQSLQRLWVHFWRAKQLVKK